MQNLVGAVAQSGQATRIVSLQTGDCVDRMRQAGFAVDVLDIPKPPPPGRGLRGKISQVLAQFTHATRFAKRLADRLETLSPLVIHWQSPNLSTLCPRTAQRLGALPVWEIPNVIGGDRWRLAARLLAPVMRHTKTLMLANSAFTAKSWHGLGVDCRVFHLGADQSIFDRQRIEAVTRESMNLPSDAIVFAIVARLEPSKGQLLFWESLLPFIERGENVYLLLLGGPLESEYVDAMQRLAAQTKVQERLRLLGHVAAPEKYYEAVDIAVNARIDAEPFGLSVIEAMMMGRPAMVHALGGPSETVVDGVTGWHVSRPTREAWSAAIDHVLAERNDWPKIGAAAYERAVGEFTCHRQAERYLAYLADRLGDKNA